MVVKRALYLVLMMALMMEYLMVVMMDRQ
jgi:hypothetical protein